MAALTTVALPGLIDCHVHFREPGLEHKGTMLSEGLAARGGGVATVCDMPNTVPGTNTVEALRDKVRRSLPLRSSQSSSSSAATEQVLPPPSVAAGGVVDLRFFFGATDMHHVEELRRLWTDPALADLKAYCCGLKLYLEHSTGDMKASDAVVDEAFRACGELNIPLVCHCENCAVNAAVLEARSWKTVADAPDDVRLHSDLRPARSETASIEEAIARAAKFHCAMHVAHLSTKAGLALVQAAKRDGLRVSCEVAPHHLFLTTEDYAVHGTKVKVNVPLRTLEDRDAMWQGVLDGSISCIATDHAPHLLTEKGLAGGGCCGSSEGHHGGGAAKMDSATVRPLLAPSGIPGVEFVVPLMASVMLGHWPHPTSTPPTILALDAGMGRSAFTKEHLVRAMYDAPNELLRLGLPPSSSAASTVRPTTMIQTDRTAPPRALGPALSKCGWSPYSDWMVRGRVFRSDVVVVSPSQ